MELPKNITQIGEADQHCRVYVEDYVVSYIKQMNRQAENRNMAIALYGVRKEENGIAYVFFYGAGKVNSIQKEVRHLSQAQLQEIEKLRKRYFSDYDFMGYRMLDGEMVEGFHICEQGTCRYIKGYACFYEKNDVMLAYMLDSRKEEVPPETVDQEKFERVRKRQEERRIQYREGTLTRQTTEKTDTWSEWQADGLSEQQTAGVSEQQTGRWPARSVGKWSGQQADKEAERVDDKKAERERKLILGKTQHRRDDSSGKGNLDKGSSKSSFRMMKVAVAAVFLLLCVLGIAGMNDFGGMEAIQTAGKQLIAEFSEQKLPDSDTQQTSGQSNTLVTEDKLTSAIQQENSAQMQTAASNEQQTAEISTENNEGNSRENSADGAENTSGTAESTGVNADEPEKASESGNTAENNGDEANGESADDGSANDGASQQPQESSEQSQESPEQSQEASVQASAPVAYIIKKGDTLTSISIKTYGTDSRVKDICELNGIENPDDIRFGQKILLP